MIYRTMFASCFFFALLSPLSAQEVCETDEYCASLITCPLIVPECDLETGELIYDQSLLADECVEQERRECFRAAITILSAKADALEIFQKRTKRLKRKLRRLKQQS